MTTKTLTWVADDVSAYESNGKTTYYVNVSFEDKSSGSLGKQNQAKARELRDMLAALKNQPAEFGLEDKGKPNKNGQPSYKIKSFPGYEPSPFEGGGGGKSSWQNSEDGVRYLQERMDRRTALMQGVAYVAAFPAEEEATRDRGHDFPELVFADQYYFWLRKTAGGGGGGALSSGPSVAAAPSPAPSSGVSPVTAGEERMPTRSAPDAPVEQGSGLFGEGSTGPCSHSSTSPLAPSGKALPEGKTFCLDCRSVIRV
jgi:hypothetical protein